MVHFLSQCLAKTAIFPLFAFKDKQATRVLKFFQNSTHLFHFHLKILDFLRNFKNCHSLTATSSSMSHTKTIPEREMLNWEDQTVAGSKFRDKANLQSNIWETGFFGILVNPFSCAS